MLKMAAGSSGPGVGLSIGMVLAIGVNTTVQAETDAALAQELTNPIANLVTVPPVNAFWSLTAYNSKDFLITNPIDRFALGDRDDLSFNKDGSLDIYIQNTDPKGDKTANWLPSTQEGLTNLTLRLYWPKESVLNGSWKVPAVNKVKM